MIVLVVRFSVFDFEGNSEGKMLDVYTKRVLYIHRTFSLCPLRGPSQEYPSSPGQGFAPTPYIGRCAARKLKTKRPKRPHMPLSEYSHETTKHSSPKATTYSPSKPAADSLSKTTIDSHLKPARLALWLPTQAVGA
jgi:hypothetical protein